jgi:hypothetical protein
MMAFTFEYGCIGFYRFIACTYSNTLFLGLCILATLALKFSLWFVQIMALTYM